MFYFTVISTRLFRFGPDGPNQYKCMIMLDSQTDFVHLFLIAIFNRCHGHMS